MDCVEVVPLRELLHRKEAERYDKRGKQLRSELDDHAFDVTPEKPFIPRVSRALQEKDEIGRLRPWILEVGTVLWY